MAKRLVGRPGNDGDSAFTKNLGAARDLARGDSKRELQRKDTDRGRRIIEDPATLPERQQVGADAKLDPSRAKRPMKWKAERRSVELAHGHHLAREDDRVIKTPDRQLRVHGHLTARARGTGMRPGSPDGPPPASCRCDRCRG